MDDFLSQSFGYELSSEADDFICLTEMMSGQTFTDCFAAIDETTEKGG